MSDVPAQSLDAEESVLGACLISPGAVDACAEILTPEAFYRQSHGMIFQAILDVAEKGEPVDALTVVGRLDADGKLGDRPDQIEAVRVHELSAIVPAAGNAAHYAKIVRAMWLRREIAAVGHQLINLGGNGAESVSDLLAEADRKVLSISQLAQGKNSTVFTGKDLATEYRYRMEHPEEFESKIVPPFSFLEDQIIDGQLHVLAGYQGTGKTALLWQFAASALDSGSKVGIWTLEMTPAALTDRWITSQGVASTDVRKGKIALEDRGKVEAALEKLETWDLEVIRDQVVTPESVRRQQRIGKYDLILIDHLHRLPVKNPAHKRIELEEAVRKITNVALEFNVPIILLAQLTRGTQSDPFPRPTRVQLRETGMIENEAALIWFIWRKWDGTGFENEAEWITDKNRFGAPSWKRLSFRASQVRFTEASLASFA